MTSTPSETASSIAATDSSRPQEAPLWSAFS
jgi:hypothetical protein